MTELVSTNRAAIEAHLRRLGWIGAEETVRALGSPGDGNMNRTLRAELPARSLILKQAVPYVAKYPQIAAPVRRLESEAAFYRLISGCEALARHTPALLGEDRGSHLLCLEDLGDTGDLTFLYAIQHGTQYGAAGSAAAARALPLLAQWLAALHALPVDAGAVPDNIDMRLLNHAHLFEVPFDPENGVDLPALLRSMQAELAGDPGVRRRAAELGDLYLGRAPAHARPALLHGDFYPGSWLLGSDGRIAVIDPEFAFIGPPEFDAGVMLAHLRMAGLDSSEIRRVYDHYAAPAGFDQGLADAFAAMEVVRRLLGVAQLPLAADDTTRARWLRAAREVLAT